MSILSRWYLNPETNIDISIEFCEADSGVGMPGSVDRAGNGHLMRSALNDFLAEEDPNASARPREYAKVRLPS